MAERPQFNFARLSTASKILLVAGLLYLIDLFLSWQKVDVGFGCCKASGWHGVGIICGLIVIAILVIEGALLAGVDFSFWNPQLRNMVEAALAGALLLFTIIKILVNNDFIKFPAWLGLILAVIVAYGGFMRWQEASVTTPPPAQPGAGGGGFAP